MLRFEQAHRARDGVLQQRNRKDVNLALAGIGQSVEHIGQGWLGKFHESEFVAALRMLDFERRRERFEWF